MRDLQKVFFLSLEPYSPIYPYASLPCLKSIQILDIQKLFFFTLSNPIVLQYHPHTLYIAIRVPPFHISNLLTSEICTSNSFSARLVFLATYFTPLSLARAVFSNSDSHVRFVPILLRSGFSGELPVVVVEGFRRRRRQARILELTTYIHTVRYTLHITQTHTHSDISRRVEGH